MQVFVVGVTGQKRGLGSTRLADGQAVANLIDAGKATSTSDWVGDADRGGEMFDQGCSAAEERTQGSGIHYARQLFCLGQIANTDNEPTLVTSSSRPVLGGELDTTDAYVRCLPVMSRKDMPLTPSPISLKRVPGGRPAVSLGLSTSVMIVCDRC